MSTPDRPAFACPCCGVVSHNPSDVEQGYCGRCHWWTGDLQLGLPHLEEPCEMRVVNPEFAAFRRGFREHTLDGVPEDQKPLWRELW